MHPTEKLVVPEGCQQQATREVHSASKVSARDVAMSHEAYSRYCTACITIRDPLDDHMSWWFHEVGKSELEPCPSSSPNEARRLVG